MEMNPRQERPQAKQAPQYHADAPYPPIAVEEPNRSYINLLKGDFAAPKSELSSVLQYLYQGWMLKKNFPEISQDMHGIAVVEMHHLDIWGQVIPLLGGTSDYSCYQRGRTLIWNGTDVFTCKNVRHMLLDNLAREKAAVAQYRQQASSIRDACIVALIERIILDEELHIQIFQKHLESLPNCP